MVAGGFAALVEAVEFFEGDVELDLGGLSGPVGEAVAGDQPPAGLLERIVIPLPLGPGVLRPGFLSQRVQDGLHRFGAAGGQVAVEPAGAAQGGLEPDLAVFESVIAVVVGFGQAAAHLLGQPGQVGQFGAAGGGAEEDLVGVVAGVFGEPVGPVADLPGPGLGDPASGQGVGDGGVGAEPPHPPDRRRTRRRR